MRQVIRAVSKPIQAQITIPGSKSITNRALVLAALAKGVSHLSGVLISDDTRVVITALQQLGIDMQLDETLHTCVVTGGGGYFPQKKASIWCGDAGTAVRFLLAVCALSSGEYYFSGSAQLCARPLKNLLKILIQQGAKISPEDAEKMPFCLYGTNSLRGGEIKIENDETSQFASSLLMIAPFLKPTVTLKLMRAVVSPYIEMTSAMMAEFGVSVKRLHNACFTILPAQHYRACDYVIEPDLSTASYFFAAAAVTGGQVTIQAIDRKNCLQGDVAFLTVLEKMGCVVSEDTQGLCVQGPKVLQGVNVDMRDFSDTFMTVCAIAAFATTPTTITNIGHTRLQESNRITAMRKNLEVLNIKVEEGGDWIKVFPSEPRAGVVDSHGDHRIAMACSIIGLRIPGIEIDHAECVSKTCPAFFQLWEML
jgi:3-phosphoshikimate 1-carboxyvinyltransferase